jgi:hypothetical protein
MRHKICWNAARLVPATLTVALLAPGCEGKVLDPVPTGAESGFLSDSTPVQQMTDAQRAAWCHWYIGTVVPANLRPGGACACPCSVDQTHYAGFAAVGAPMGLCATAPPEDLCVENLALSRCEAPISDLSHCVAQMWGFRCGTQSDGTSCPPCDQFRDTTGCFETILSTVAEVGSTGCSLLVSADSGTPSVGHCPGSPW